LTGVWLSTNLMKKWCGKCLFILLALGLRFFENTWVAGPREFLFIKGT
jgi:hypothetical protein